MTGAGGRTLPASQVANDTSPQAGTAGMQSEGKLTQGPPCAAATAHSRGTAESDLLVTGWRGRGGGAGAGAAGRSAPAMLWHGSPARHVHGGAAPALTAASHCLPNSFLPREP